MFRWVLTWAHKQIWLNPGSKHIITLYLKFHVNLVDRSLLEVVQNAVRMVGKPHVLFWGVHKQAIKTSLK